jgi:hypothetical protein
MRIMRRGDEVVNLFLVDNGSNFFQIRPIVAIFNVFRHWNILLYAL